MLNVCTESFSFNLVMPVAEPIKKFDAVDSL
jgi:hypothetical protein